MSVTRKNIDDLSRTLSVVTGAERIPGRDGSGDFKTLISSIYTYFKNEIIDTDTTLAANSDALTASQKAIKAYIAAQIAAATGMPIGSIGIWPSSLNIPTDWSETDGSAISRSIYATLFGIIGTVFGVGDGSTTFNLPDTATNGDFIRHCASGISEAIGTHQATQLIKHGHYFVDQGGTPRAGFDSSTSAGSDDGFFRIANATGDIKVGEPLALDSDPAVNTGTKTYPDNNAFIFIIKIS